MQILNRRAKVGGLLNAKTEHRDLGIGIQERISQMLPQSMGAVRYGLHFGLFKYSRETATLTPLESAVKVSGLPLNVRKMFWTSERLGLWMGTGPVEIVCAHLEISF
ncbi:MAG: hypothetical protein KDD60_09410 [Bdellovibrionales bacterium]|nr:hypothetical protein [Bdellovibrionales bacterium]